MLESAQASVTVLQIYASPFILSVMHLSVQTQQQADPQQAEKDDHLLTERAVRIKLMRPRLRTGNKMTAEEKRCESRILLCYSSTKRLHKNSTIGDMFRSKVTASESSGQECMQPPAWQP